MKTQSNTQGTTTAKACERERAELLADAALKPILHVHQIDCNMLCLAEEEFRPDKADCSICYREKRDLRDRGSEFVRLQIPVGVGQTGAAGVLEELLVWVKEHPDIFRLPPSTTELNRYHLEYLIRFADGALKRARKILRKRERASLPYPVKLAT